MSVWEDERVLGIDRGKGCTTLRMCFMLNGTVLLKMVKMGSFTLCIFYHNFGGGE